MSSHKDIHWEGPQERCQLNSQWFYARKNTSGWCLTPVAKVMEARRLGILHQFMDRSKQQPSCGWIQIAHEMMQAARNGWTKTHSDIVFWKPITTNHKKFPEIGHNFLLGGRTRGRYDWVKGGNQNNNRFPLWASYSFLFGTTHQQVLRHMWAFTDLLMVQIQNNDIVCIEHMDTLLSKTSCDRIPFWCPTMSSKHSSKTK